VSVYEKGLNAEGIKDRVVVDVEKEEVSWTLSVCATQIKRRKS
jgi:hypothetical protein